MMLILTYKINTYNDKHIMCIHIYIYIHIHIHIHIYVYISNNVYKCYIYIYTICAAPLSEEGGEAAEEAEPEGLRLLRYAILYYILYLCIMISYTIIIHIILYYSICYASSPMEHCMIQYNIL